MPSRRGKIQHFRAFIKVAAKFKEDTEHLDETPLLKEIDAICKQPTRAYKKPRKSALQSFDLECFREGKPGFVNEKSAVICHGADGGGCRHPEKNTIYPPFFAADFALMYVRVLYR
ncbi:hypothetical protein RvY_08307 [Ramazzottius varieornatus]|uniref:Uncharacterized protein n=1 Tax=Ramazzottius varieornatus TaxID=947166 RepID=A0A1D1V5H6_RAMVA|nr:hypothetical protein RvY_08307 [Ramazzottius varieornatus]